MTEEQFRSSAFRTEFDEFLQTPCGQTLLSILTESLTPTPVDPNAAVTAWVAAHEKLIGKQEMLQLTVDLSQPVPPKPGELRSDFGVPESELPDPDKL